MSGPSARLERIGPYRIVDRLAVGGMAEVFRALESRPAGEPRTVVVKRMLPAVAAQPRAGDMFRAEARIGASLRHENIVEVLAFGDEDGQPYLALEYVRGVDLWRLLRHLTRHGQTLGVPLSIFVVRELLAGLEAVHHARDEDGSELGLVHRDVSPSNVLLSVHGEVKLADFGIAWAALRGKLPSAPSNERAKGKLGYLAPEQVVGEECDRRADVFSAAVIAAELLMGRTLFAGGSELAVLLAIRDAKIHPFREAAQHLPPGLGSILIDALARDREARMGSAGELSELLLLYAGEDDAAMRSQLAGYVATAMAESDDEGSREDRTPMVDTSRLRDSSGERTPVHAARETMPAQAAAPSGPGSEPITAPPPPLDDSGRATSQLGDVHYRLLASDGEELGPFTYAQLVEAIAIGRVGPADRVRGTDELTRIADIPSLARHLPPSTQRFTPSAQSADAPAQADEVVPLAYGGFVSAMAWSAIRRDTGLWLCGRGEVHKEVYVAGGVPEFVSSNIASELLGEYLVVKKVISRGELDMALAVMPRFEGRLGDTLAALGLVEPVHLFRHIAAQVRDKLLDLFLWDGGQAELYRGVQAPPSPFPLGLDPWQILDEGLARRLEAGLEDHRFEGREEALVRRADDVPAEIAHAPLTADARSVLLRLGRPTSMPELAGGVLGDTAARTARVRRALVLLMHLGAAEWA